MTHYVRKDQWFPSPEEVARYAEERGHLVWGLDEQHGADGRPRGRAIELQPNALPFLLADFYRWRDGDALSVSEVETIFPTTQPGTVMT